MPLLSFAKIYILLENQKVGPKFLSFTMSGRLPLTAVLFVSYNRSRTYKKQCC